MVPLGFRRGAPSNATGCGSGIAPHDAAFALRLQEGKERGSLRQQIYANHCKSMRDVFESETVYSSV